MEGFDIQPGFDMPITDKAGNPFVTVTGVNMPMSGNSVFAHFWNYV